MWPKALLPLAFFVGPNRLQHLEVQPADESADGEEDRRQVEDGTRLQGTTLECLPPKSTRPMRRTPTALKHLAALG